MIQVQEVSKSYNGKENVIYNLSFEVKKGEIVGFIGPNGSGKTTTLKMLTGILPSDKGKIFIDGKRMTDFNISAKKQIGYIPDSPDMFLRLKGVEFLNFMGDVYEVETKARRERIEKLTKTFELEHVLDASMVSYSHGMRQKMMIVATLLHEPAVWILDEPLTGLDPKSSFVLKKMMKEHAANGNCVLFSTHVLEVAEKLCDRVVMIKKGEKLYEGTLEELKTKQHMSDLEEIFLEMTEENLQEEPALTEKENEEE